MCPVEKEESVDLNNFDAIKNRGLPATYNLVDGDGWWVD